MRSKLRREAQLAGERDTPFYRETNVLRINSH